MTTPSSNPLTSWLTDDTLPIPGRLVGLAKKMHWQDYRDRINRDDLPGLIFESTLWSSRTFKSEEGRPEISIEDRFYHHVRSSLATFMFRHREGLPSRRKQGTMNDWGRVDHDRISGKSRRRAALLKWLRHVSLHVIPLLDEEAWVFYVIRHVEDHTMEETAELMECSVSHLRKYNEANFPSVIGQVIRRWFLGLRADEARWLIESIDDDQVFDDEEMAGFFHVTTREISEARHGWPMRIAV